MEKKDREELLARINKVTDRPEFKTIRKVTVPLHALEAANPAFRAAQEMINSWPESSVLPRVFGTMPDFIQELDRKTTPVARLLNIPLNQDESLDRYFEKVANEMEGMEPLSPWQVAMLIQMARGGASEDPRKSEAESALVDGGSDVSEKFTKAAAAALIAERQRELAKRPRNRHPSNKGGKALVSAVHKESRKKFWTTAWDWLCIQADNRVSVGDFILESVSPDRAEVAYFHEPSAGKQRPIKKLTFKKYWDQSSKKDRFLAG